MIDTAPVGTSAPAAGPGTGDGIDHGTPKGYRQHRTKGVAYCDDCRAAIREDNRRKRRSTDSQQKWNRGHVGKPTEPRPQPVGRECTTTGCRELGSLPRPAAHMVLIEVPGSREPSRWYCPGGCAVYGQALADVRAIGGAR